MSRALLAAMVLAGSCPLAPAVPPAPVLAEEARQPVQSKVDRLLSQIRRALPGARINVIPLGPESVILAGSVPRAEDIPLAIALARGNAFQVLPSLEVN